MTTYIKDLIDLPQQVNRGDFVLNLADGVRRSRQTLDTYVVTPQLAASFRNALAFLKGAVDARTSRAAYLHGSFGAGKSHFMAVLHLLLQHDPQARTRDELAPICAENAWVEGKKFLLVPYHLVGARDLESAVLGGYAKHVAELHPDKPWPGVFKGDALIEDARAMRAELGDERFFAKLGQGGGDSDWGDFEGGWNAERFERASSTKPWEREPDSNSEAYQDWQQLVADLVRYVFPAYRTLADGRHEAFVSIDEGLSILSRHAQMLGYDALILFLDELVLWLATHAADLAFVQREGQKLAKLVEGANANRPVPLISFVARQRDLRELVGTHVTGAEQLGFADVLGHWEGRFHTIRLDDRNLPDIAEKRILKPKTREARVQMDDAFERIRRERQSVLDVLLTSSSTPEMFRKVYPFSPALVETLVAVSSALQRERTALKMMLELLVQQRDTLELGQLIPVGDLFDIVAFSDETFTGVLQASFENARRLYRDKLRPLVEEEHGIPPEGSVARERSANEPTTDPTRAARLRSFRADDRLLKTVLLAALVPEVEALKNLTGEKLAALNHGSLKTPIPGGEKSMVIQRFRRWAGLVGEIRVGVDSANPVISIHLTGVDTESVLLQAQAEDNRGNRQLMIRRLIFEALEVRTPEEACVTLDVIWRGTKRPVQLLYANVRELTDHSLESEGDGWRIILDWPFDEAEYGPQHDAARLERYAREVARSTRTIVWLPSFFSNKAMKELGTLVKLDYVLSGERFNQCSQHLAQSDRPVAKLLLGNQRDALRHKMLEWLEMVFGFRNAVPDVLDAVVEPSDHLQTLCTGFQPRPPVGATFKSALRQLVSQALAFQYPAHPVFEPDDREIRPGQLKTVWEHLEKAVEVAGGRIDVEERVRSQVRQVVVPMHLGDMGETAFVLGRHWLTHFNRKIEEHRTAAPTVGDLYQWMDEPQPMGLQPLFRNLLVKLFAEQTRRSFARLGTVVEAALDEVRPGLELVNMSLPDENHWKRATALARTLMDVPEPRTLNAASVSRFAAAVREAASKHTRTETLVRDLHHLMQEVGIEAPRDTPRMHTAIAARDFVTVCQDADDVRLVTRMAAAPMHTNEACVRKSLDASDATVASIQKVQPTLFQGLRNLSDSRQERAETILDALRRVLCEDEHGIELNPALAQACADAVRLAFKPAEPPLIVTPPIDPPPEIITPPHMTRISHGKKGTMPVAEARQLLKELLSRLPEDGHINLTWEIWKKDPQ